MLNVRSSGPSCERLGAEQRADLVRFAAEPDDQHAGEVRVARVAAERPPQERHPLAARIHPAARSVRQRDHAVDVGKTREPLAREVLGDPARDRCRAVDRGQDAEIVARRHAAVGTHDALERRRGIDALRRLRVHAERVVAVEAAHLEVVQVHVLAGRDVAARETDDLVVAAHRLARPDRARRDLVARRDEPAHRHALLGEERAADELRARYHHVVVGVKPDRERGRSKHLGSLHAAGTRARATARRSIAGQSHSMPRPGVDGALAKPASMARRDDVSSSS